MKRNYISATQVFLSFLHCTTCKKVLQIPRKKSEVRKYAHVKTMDCPMCKCERDFVETKNGTTEEFQSAIDYINHQKKVRTKYKKRKQ